MFRCIDASLSLVNIVNVSKVKNLKFEEMRFLLASPDKKWLLHPLDRSLRTFELTSDEWLLVDDHPDLSRIQSQELVVLLSQIFLEPMVVKNLLGLGIPLVRLILVFAQNPQFDRWKYLQLLIAEVGEDEVSKALHCDQICDPPSCYDFEGDILTRKLKFDLLCVGFYDSYINAGDSPGSVLKYIFPRSLFYSQPSIELFRYLDNELCKHSSMRLKYQTIVDCKFGEPVIFEFAAENSPVKIQSSDKTCQDSLLQIRDHYRQLEGLLTFPDVINQMVVNYCSCQ